MPFDLDKQNILARTDKSSKGSMDEPITPLVNALNAHPNYVTTSSCSGRIVLLATDDSFDKTHTTWTYISHGSVCDSLWHHVEQATAPKLWFRYEGAILHAKCRDLTAAKHFTNLARNCGFKRTGIISMTDHPLIELTSSESITAPLVDGTLLITPNYLASLVRHANTMLTRNHHKLTAVTQSIRTLRAPAQQRHTRQQPRTPRAD